jgi:hypothetical protein
MVLKRARNENEPAGVQRLWPTTLQTVKPFGRNHVMTGGGKLPLASRMTWRFVLLSTKPLIGRKDPSTDPGTRDEPNMPGEGSCLERDILEPNLSNNKKGQYLGKCSADPCGVKWNFKCWNFALYWMSRVARFGPVRQFDLERRLQEWHWSVSVERFQLVFPAQCQHGEPHGECSDRAY